MLVSSEQLDQMAAQAYAKLRAEASRKGTLNQDRTMLARVRAIASRLEPSLAFGVHFFRPPRSIENPM